MRYFFACLALGASIFSVIGGVIAGIMWFAETHPHIIENLQLAALVGGLGILAIFLCFFVGHLFKSWGNDDHRWH